MLTPLDIENKKFSKQMMNGYSIDEVDDFLDELTIDYEKMYKELQETKAKVDELNKNLEHYRNIEETLQSTLIMAQSTAEEVKKNVDDLELEIISKKKQIEDTQKQFDIYKAKMEALLISQLELLKDVNED